MAGVLIWIFGIGCLVLIVVLVLLRITFGVLNERAELRADRLRVLFFDVLIGEGEAVLVAERTLMRLQGRHWETARKQAFRMLPKLRGDSRETLVRLLHDKGAARVALRQVSSWSALDRCHGAFALGMLGDQRSAQPLIGCLDDRDFLVRRVATRALGNLRSREAVRPLLELGRREPRLARDLIFALHRIGPEVKGPLRAELGGSIDGDLPALSGQIVANVLGLLGDYTAKDLLVRGLDSFTPALAAACADALGAICAPDTEPALVRALDHPSGMVRSAAAKALGSMGSSASVRQLGHLMDAADPLGSREAAGALLELGPVGRARLAISGSPYAAEALALADLRAGR